MRRASAFSASLGAAALSAAALCVGGHRGRRNAGADTARALDAYGQIEDPALQARYERIIQTTALSGLPK